MAKKKINSKSKGSTYERKLKNELNNLGLYENEIFTSRYASRITDNKKIDLYGTEPFSIQAKANETMSMSKMIDILGEMPDDNNINCIFRKINRKEEVVVVTKKDFYKLMESYIKQNKAD